MTPREHQTLDLILRDVEKHTGKTARGSRVDRILMLDFRRNCYLGGDYLIVDIEFRSTGAQCA
jgi:hypothetical protein